MQRFLLDTHTLIWYLEGNPQLSNPVRELLNRGDVRFFVSAVSWWEIALKSSLGKLQTALPLTEMLQESNSRYLEWLPISSTHILRVSQLPFPANGHRDPFDRLLIAQAQVEDMILLSRDSKFDDYPVRRHF